MVEQKLPKLALKRFIAAHSDLHGG